MQCKLNCVKINFYLLGFLLLPRGATREKSVSGANLHNFKSLSKLDSHLLGN